MRAAQPFRSPLVNAGGDRFAGNIAVIGACLKPLASLENVHPISERVNCLTGETEVCSHQHRDPSFEGRRWGAQRTPRMDTARPTFSPEHQMRLALATAFALIVLPATALSQGVRIDALSLQSGARARILAPTAGSKYELI